jgi:hypothetical protein
VREALEKLIVSGGQEIFWIVWERTFVSKSPLADPALSRLNQISSSTSNIFNFNWSILPSRRMSYRKRSVPFICLYQNFDMCVSIHTLLHLSTAIMLVFKKWFYNLCIVSVESVKELELSETSGLWFRVFATSTHSKKCLSLSEMRLAFDFLLMNENHQNPKHGIVWQ